MTDETSMLNSKSIKTRFLLSVASNTARAGINFLSGLLVARALSPAGYGDLTFLLVSFSAIRTLLDMGSSNAFYTFISAERKGPRFYVFYGGWLAIQFTIVAALVAVIMPQELIAKVWLDHDRTTILLAFGATFMQQQVWQMITQIGEAARKTVRTQTINMAVGIVHFALIAFFFIAGRLSVELIFFIIIIEYLLAAAWASRFLRHTEADDKTIPADLSFPEMMKEYGRYCRPLILLSWIGFAYNFADGWLLQRFGGAGQQGFYQIASQFAGVSLIATTSILNILWKEVAEAHGRGDTARTAELYRKVNHGLLMFGAVLSGLLIPWTHEIVKISLGEAYLMAAPVMMVMFLYPIHQSMGQVGGTMLLASGRTSAYMIISGCFMLISLPVSYIIQAPPEAVPFPGFGLGAEGMALKTVVLNVVSVNVQAWIVARYCGIKYDWFYQIVAVSGVVAIGYASRLFSGIFFDLAGITGVADMIAPFLFSIVAYIAGVFILIWAMPWLAGIERSDITNAIKKISPFHI